MRIVTLVNLGTDVTVSKVTGIVEYSLIKEVTVVTIVTVNIVSM